MEDQKAQDQAAEQTAAHADQQAVPDPAQEIQLPQDYDKLSSIPGMNDEIRNLISQALAQAEDQHKAALEDVHNEHKTVTDQLQATVSDLTTQNANLQQIYDAEQAAHAATKSKLLDEQQARQDAEHKRDNAVAQLEQTQAEHAKALKQVESLNGQIDELEGIVKTLKKPTAPTGGLTFTSTLKPETDEERAARLNREKLERINRNMTERLGLPPLKLPELPSKPTEEVTSEQLDAAFPGVAGGQAVAPDDAAGEGVSEATAVVDGAEHAEAAPTLEARVRSLEVVAKEMIEWKLQVKEQIAGLTFQR